MISSATSAAATRHHLRRRHPAPDRRIPGLRAVRRSVVITHHRGQPAAEKFQRRLETLGIRVYRHYIIPDYPSDVARIVSDDGFGRNDYIETTRSLIVVTAPGPGSGKMATCLSQLYHEHKRGVCALRQV